MHLLNLLRGHFALLENKTFTTMGERSTFKLVRAMPRAPRQYATWLLEVKPEPKGDPHCIYFSDMLRVYAFLADRDLDDRWCTMADIRNECLCQVAKNSESYLLPLLSTLDDVDLDESEDGIRIQVRYPKAEVI